MARQEKGVHSLILIVTGDENHDPYACEYTRASLFETLHHERHIDTANHPTNKDKRCITVQDESIIL